MNEHQELEQAGFGNQPIKYEKRLAAIRIQLHSQLPSDVKRGMEQARKLLQDDPSNQEIYPLLLEVARESIAQREEIRSLLQSMIQKGSKPADNHLKELEVIAKPSQPAPELKNDPPEKEDTDNKQSLIDDADDAYYATEFDKAISLYQRVLQQEPNNKRAQKQLEKSELNRIAQQPNRKLPRDAMQYYRRARSYIAATDIKSAISMLNAAVEEAHANQMKFPEAEDLLSSQQDLQIASEYKEQAIGLIQEEKWEETLELYERILKLDAQDETSKIMRSKLRNLMETEALLVTLSDPLDDELSRQEKLQKIASSLKEGEGIRNLTNTNRFTKIRAAYNLYKAEADLHKWRGFTAIAPRGRLKEVQRTTKSKNILGSDDPALKFVDERIRQLQPLRITFFVVLLLILGYIFFLILNHDQDDIIPPITSTPTPTIAFTPTDTPPLPTETPTHTPTPTVTSTITVTDTALSPTQATLGNGYVNPFYTLIHARETPNGKAVGDLTGYQVVTILEQQTVSQARWYLCQWDANGTTAQGWILAEYIIFGPIPTKVP